MDVAVEEREEYRVGNESDAVGRDRLGDRKQVEELWGVAVTVWFCTAASHTQAAMTTMPKTEHMPLSFIPSDVQPLSHKRDKETKESMN